MVYEIYILTKFGNERENSAVSLNLFSDKSLYYISKINNKYKHIRKFKI